MKALTRGLILAAVIVLVLFLHPIMGRSIILFSLPFVVSLLLLIKFSKKTTVYVGLVISLYISIRWGLTYISSTNLLIGLIIGLVTFFVSMLGVYSAVLINKLIR